MMKQFKQMQPLKFDSANHEETWHLWNQKFVNLVHIRADDVKLAIFLQITGDDALIVCNAFTFTEADSLQPAQANLE